MSTQLETLLPAGLAELAERINTEHRLCEQALRSSLQHALAAGEALIAAKSRCRHGDWLPWLAANCEVSERSARVYMQVARGLPTLELKSAAAADLTLSEAVALLAEPKVDPFEGMEPRERSPETPAELVIWRFRRHGSIPGHEPYPEERLPDLFAPPIAVRRLPLASIIIDPDLEFRTDEPRRLEDAAWYAQIFEVLPPIAVFDVGGEFVLADGHYRIAAARLLGLREVECRVYASGFTDRHCARVNVDMYGVATNCGGGLPYTMADYEHQLRMLRKAGEIA